MLGQKPEIGEPDVWRQIGENLSRQLQKASAPRSAARDGGDADSRPAADGPTGRRARMKAALAPKRAIGSEVFYSTLRILSVSAKVAIQIIGAVLFIHVVETL
jgi:hypothetical protein